MSYHFNLFESDRPLRLKIQLVDDDEKLTCQPPQGSTWTTAVLTMLKKADTRIE